MNVVIIKVNDSCGCHPEYITDSILYRKIPFNLAELEKEFQANRTTGYSTNDFVNWLVICKNFKHVDNHEEWDIR
jgi:hypothetical protein